MKINVNVPVLCVTVTDWRNLPPSVQEKEFVVSDAVVIAGTDVSYHAAT